MEEALIKRIPPHSLEAEQSVIGAMLLDRDAILVASEILTSDDFYQNQYGIIFDAMVELCNEGKPVDLVTLQNRLKEKDLPPDISSMEYVRELIEAVPTSANVKYYANIVSEKALLRRLIRGAQMDGDGFGDIGFSRHEEASFRVIDPVARSHRRSVPHPRPPFRATG